ncbi:MAG TPA: hypothetical protein VD927_16970 [Chryseosolibacter sp.]|nr:hypothetical protein [Chryseosolibacter sp.]
MKRLFSISFIATLLLNVMGYYGVFLGLQYNHEMEMIRVLDANHYDESRAITLRIPVSIPYMNDDMEFKRVYGKFQHLGQHYRLVKQKYKNDTLTIICVRDYKRERITEALSAYLKTFTDSPLEQGQSKIQFNFIKDYISQTHDLLVATTGWEAELIQYGFCINLISSFTALITHPPESV